ncbi:unnamed protein product [Blepharisma stoltei]|uniref:non-specific serine/threonine protein kinase n=1 Tax=Blepharisma stoltei TaxID=1481888 RepID=A0AAU9K8B3_9CILI|nr:unnamed protein product [Blepharisma stoltei]
MDLEGSPFKDYKVIQTLGRGAYGTVYRVSSPEGADFVLKSISLEHLSKRKQQDALKEVTILQGLSHSHIIHYFSNCVHDNKLLILMEFAKEGDLQTLINRQREKRLFFSEKLIWNIAYEICLGVEYLHTQHIAHRDIKCMNILLDDDKRARIADMGVSKIMQEDNVFEGTQVGTPLYLSPELVQHQPYDFKVDVWAIGCVLYNLATLEPPFQAENLISLANKIVKTRQKPLPGCYSARLNNFIFKLLEKKPKIRPSIAEVLSLFPKYVKENYKEPKLVTNKPNSVEPNNNSVKNESPKPLPKILGQIEVKPGYSIAKRTASVGKYPQRFNNYLISNNKLSSSRSLCWKPGTNSSTNFNTAKDPAPARPSTAVFSERRVIVPQRPSTAHPAVNHFSSFQSVYEPPRLKLVFERPSSAAKKATVSDLLNLL